MAFGTLCGLEVVRYVGAKGSPATSREISTATGISRATIYRILNELVAAGWLIEEGSPRKFTPSWEVVGLGLAVLTHNHTREIALRSLLDLATETSKPVFLSFPDGLDTVTTDIVEVIGGRTMPSTSFNRAPMLISSAGRAILARLPDTETERLIAAGFPHPVETAPGGPEHVRLAIQRARQRGYGVCDGEIVAGQVSMSAPLLDGRGRPVATIGLSDPRPRSEVEGDFAEILLQWARRASIELGYRVTPIRVG